MKKSVLYMAQKNITVMSAKYPPRTIPVAKISLSFQLSGCGDAFTLSLEIVMMVPRNFMIDKVNVSQLESLDTVNKVIVVTKTGVMKISPSFRIAIINTMNGAKSNFHIKAINMKPNCHIRKNMRCKVEEICAP